MYLVALSLLSRLHGDVERQYLRGAGQHHHADGGQELEQRQLEPGGFANGARLPADDDGEEVPKGEESLDQLRKEIDAVDTRGKGLTLQVQSPEAGGHCGDAGNQSYGPRRAVAQGEHGRQKQQQRHDQTDRLGQKQQDVEHAQNLPMKTVVAPFIMSRRTLGTKPKNTRSAIRIARGRICQPDRSTLVSSCQRGLGGPKKA